MTERQAKRKTEEADYELDDEGKVVDDGGRLAADDDVVIVEDRQEGDDGALSEGETLFGGETPAPAKTKSKKKRSRSPGKKTGKRRTKR